MSEGVGRRVGRKAVDRSRSIYLGSSATAMAMHGNP